MSREILNRLSDPALVALRCPGSAWGASLFAQTLIPDTWMGLVVRQDGLRRYVPAGEDAFGSDGLHALDTIPTTRPGPALRSYPEAKSNGCRVL